MLLFLSTLRCWKDQEAAASPWKTVVRYGISPTDILSPLVGGAYFLETDENGETTTITNEQNVVVEEALCTTAENTESVFVTTSLVRRDLHKKSLRKGSCFNHVTIEKQKTFTYSSTFDWAYRVYLRWATPCVEGLGQLSEQSIVFKQPPTCHVSITCNGARKTDPQYLSDSIICKVKDLLPTIYRECQFISRGVTIIQLQSTERVIAAPPNDSVAAEVPTKGEDDEGPFDLDEGEDMDIDDEDDD
jgi:hypothetical protein